MRHLIDVRNQEWANMLHRLYGASHNERLDGKMLALAEQFGDEEEKEYARINLECSRNASCQASYEACRLFGIDDCDGLPDAEAFVALDPDEGCVVEPEDFLSNY